MQGIEHRSSFVLPRLLALVGIKYLDLGFYVLHTGEQLGNLALVGPMQIKELATCMG
jgi:hypothetical protein